MSQKQIEKIKKYLHRRGYDIEEVLCCNDAKKEAKANTNKILGWKEWKKIKGKGPYAYYRCRVGDRQAPLSIYLGK